ncbi:histidine--tRNA ligase [Nitratiruptor sp. SB155-2]|uniref:Histidine--tRNA ligase n=1 Tax=Nitratiruptor sp. (strain SB155-2) TaxID=387092 RepID=SYH_NITSB|nr:histidine--tRNA ligase [Nitratiruptor sp. SB155-2]A6Q371.1 RecName: Full=Histidine--tRNA ligase; AltName: Full=Histidyl-tRNA synthetase; Short=HisRS [Nitratiruptor sp. SB155-2]BAF69930.1 histidyl-tRNA synthetase [Nitratiruptor sp. SB155-2]
MAIKALRGMKDILPPLSEKYLNFLQTASHYAHNYGFSYIETPLLEETALFKRSVGESSDIVGKEMYQFIDKGGNDIVLRPEGTAGVVRSFIEHKLDRQGGTHRFFYYGSMFRYERPQKGRFRQFHQFGVESFGEPSVYEDAAIITLAKAILDHFEIDYTLKINSLGCPVCLKPYREELIKFLEDQEHICDDCKRRRKLNPIRVLDCKNEQCQQIYENAPKLINNLCEECNQEFQTLKNLLDNEGIIYEVDENLVRGLDYYTRTAFEFVSNALGAQNAVAGGGRYDNLVEMLGGKPTPAVGFAIGIERILDLIKDKPVQREGYFIGVMLPEALNIAFDIATKLRQSNRVIMEYKPKSLKALLKGADRNNAKYALIIGEDEYNEGLVWIKDLERKEEKRVDIQNFMER